MTRPDFDDMAQLFGDFTAVWDAADQGAFSAWIGDQLRTGGRAIDLGCGTGRHLPVLAHRYDRVLGVDISAGMLDLARRRNHGERNVTLRQAAVLDVSPDADGVFDAVMSCAVLHQAGPPERVLPHVRGLVAPGGRLVIVDMVDPGRWSELSWHVDRAFTDARAAYDRTGDGEKAVAILRQLLDPTWLAMSVRDVPLTRAEFHRRYADAFPGATFTDDLNPLMAGMTWTAPTST